MALVAYENSDSSDIEEEEGTIASVNNVNKIYEENKETKLNKESLQNGIDTGQTSSGNIFKLLPPTKKKFEIEEEDDEFLQKKPTTVKPKTKITVPSLSDFKDVENSTPSQKPKSANGKKSGLLSILPEPKNFRKITTNSLIPNVLTQKPKNAVAKKIELLKPASVTKSIGKKPTNSLPAEYSDEDSDNDTGTDFFSINTKHELPEVADVDIDMTAAPVTHIQNIHSHSIVNEDVDMVSEQAGHSSNTHVTNHLEVVEPSPIAEVTLDDEAIRQLCGSRGRRMKQDIQIVDVKQDEVLGDAREWLVKGLMDDTSKRVSASKRKGNEPTNQQKRKHQITYLAHQAKANEVELQNQWANNRMSRRQTQSKYGF